jgi:hypothetical protein
MLSIFKHRNLEEIHCIVSGSGIDALWHLAVNPPNSLVSCYRAICSNSNVDQRVKIFVRAELTPMRKHRSHVTGVRLSAKHEFARDKACADGAALLV